MELFQVSDGCIPNSKDSKTEVLFTWEQMWCYNHHEQQSRRLGHVICPTETLTLQKVLSLTEMSFQHDPHLFDVYMKHMSLDFSLGSDFRLKFCPFITEKLAFYPSDSQFSSVQSLSHVQLFATPWTAAHQSSLSITNSRSLLKLMSIELVMPANHLILCHPLLLPSIFLSIRVLSDESPLRIRWPKYWSFSFNISP